MAIERVVYRVFGQVLGQISPPIQLLLDNPQAAEALAEKLVNARITPHVVVEAEIGDWVQVEVLRCGPGLSHSPLDPISGVWVTKRGHIAAIDPVAGSVFLSEDGDRVTVYPYAALSAGPDWRNLEVLTPVRSTQPRLRFHPELIEANDPTEVVLPRRNTVSSAVGSSMSR